MIASRKILAVFGGKLLRPCPVYQTVTALASTLKLERFNKAPLGKIGKRPSLTERHNIYRVVGRENGPKNLTIILTEDSIEFGVRGEVLELPKHFGRQLIQENKAVYASPENLEEYSCNMGEQSISGRRTVLWLREHDTFSCPFLSDTEWTLTPETLARSFLRAHDLVLMPTSITLPDYPITNKNVNDNSIHEIKIKVNNVDTVPVKITITAWTPIPETNVL